MPAPRVNHPQSELITDVRLEVPSHDYFRVMDDERRAHYHAETERDVAVAERDAAIVKLSAEHGAAIEKLTAERDAAIAAQVLISKKT